MSYTSEYYNALEKLKKRKNTDTDDLKGLDDYSAEYYRSLREAQSRQNTSKDTSFEDDIAPVSKGGDKDSWFKLGGFSDGVDSVGDFFGDLVETNLGTAADLGIGVLKGAGRLVEGVSDLGYYGASKILDVIGLDDAAEKVKKQAQYNVVDGVTKGLTDYVDQYSVLGNKADMVAEGIGQVGTIILTGGIASAGGLSAAATSALTTGLTGLSGMGSGMSEAYELGATDEEAAKYGAVVGSVEAASELIFGGLGKGVKALGLSKGLTSIDDIAAKKISNIAAKYITSEAGQKVVGNTLEWAVKSGAEGLEEVISGFGSAIAKDVYLYNDENEKPFIEILADENLLEQFVVGSITSGIAQSGIVPGMKSGSLIEANKTGRDFVTGYTASDQAVIDKVVENRVAEAEKDGKKLSKKEIGKIEEQVQDALEKGQLDIDTIENVLGGETYTAYKDNLTETAKLKQEYDKLSDIKESDLTRKQKKRLDELEAMNLDDTTKSDGLRQQLDNKLKPLLKNSKLTETYNERARRGQAFEADLTKYKGKQREAVERAINSGVLNNTYRSHELVNVLSKIEADKGVIFDYTNNAKLKESGFAIDGKTVNGFVKDGNVTLNVQSSKAWQSTVGHEITHVLEGTESYSALQSALFKYAESKGEYQSRYDSLAELYNGVKGYETDFDTKLKKELTADLVGDYLFTDQKFIQHLTGDRNLFQKVYDEIKYLCKIATGKELTEIEKVKREFDNAWKQMNVTDTKNTVNEVAVSTEGMLNEYAGGHAKFPVAQDIVDEFVSKHPDNIAPTTASNTRFSLSKSVEETNDLIAVHNLKATELLKTLELGGLPMPSIAIIKAEQEHEKYGDVSLIFPRQTIDPKASSANKVYGGDAWTPTYPRIEYKARESVAQKIKDKYYELADKIGYDAVRPMYRYVSELDDTLNSDGGEANLLNRLYDDPKMMQVYLEDSGKGKVEDVVKETRTEATEAEKEMNQWFIGKLGEDVVRSFKAPEGVSPLTHRKEFMAQHGEQVKQAYRDFFAEKFGFDEDTLNNIVDKVKQIDLITFMRKAESYLTNGGITIKTETDYDATDAAIREKAADGYQAWVDDLFKGVEEKTGIRNDKDAFTSRGDRRSWDALHWENTLENVVKAMKAQEQTGADAFSPASAIFAVAHKQYGSVEDIKADSDRLGRVSEAEYKTMEESYASRLAQIAKSIQDPSERNQFIASDEAASQIVDAVRNYKTKNGMLRYMQKWNSRVTESTVDDILSLVSDIANMPTGYFEAKPQRAVGLEEVGVFVIPNNADTKLKQELLNKGYSIAEYDPNVEGDRKRVVNQFEEYKFSLSNEGEEFTPTGNYSTPMSDTALEQDIAPVREGIAENATTTEGNIAPVQESAVQEAPQTVDEKISAKLKNLQTELDNNKKMRDESNADFDSEIARLQAEYDAKKNKNTKAANNLLRRIERMQRLKANVNADYESRISTLSERVNKVNTPQYKRGEQRRVKEEQRSSEIAKMIGDTSTWQDKKLGISYQTNTLHRNLRDVVRDANGKRDIAKADEIYEYLQGSYNRNEAELKRESQAIKQKYADMKINKYESAYIQMLGEFQYNPETKLTQEVLDDYFDKHGKRIDIDKVKKAIEESRKDYDSLIKRVNAVLREQGMKEIGYKEGYYPHFTDTKQSWLAKLFNWKTIDTEIPTDIAGLTEDFEPVRTYQSFDKQRKSDVTDYNFLKGFDTYVHGALDWIYHIEDIQKRRAFENEIRYSHSEQGIRDRIDEIRNNKELDADDAQALIDNVYKEAKNPLNNFVTDLRNSTNNLAGKKSTADRSMEYATNRKVYSTMTNISNRVSGNMVAGSISSALTNFIPITQSWGQVSPVSSLRAVGDVVRNAFRSDGMIEKSTFMTNRLMGEENLYQSSWDKASKVAGGLMDVIDQFTTQVVWRSKYIENMNSGMSEVEAINNADVFAENVMAGRSRGNMPTIYNSKNPVTKMLTAFQLEVANQYGYMFKDMPQDIGTNNAKSIAKLTAGYATMFYGAYVYNALFSKLTGRDAAFDPIGILEDLMKDLGFGSDDEEEEADVLGAVKGLGENILQEVPYVGGLLGGGRVPISSALPYDSVTKMVTGTIDDVANEDWANLTNEWLNPVYYLALPFAGGQIKKTNEGLGMFSDEHPVSGSYTTSGNLRFPVEDTPLNRLQAGLFGQYASENAREYFDNDYAPLKEKQIQEYIDVDIPIKDYWEYREGLTKQDTLEDKFDYISGLDLPIAKKNILVNNVTDRKEKVDLTGYENFSGLEEFDFANKYPEKYALSKSLGGYDSYKAYSKALNDITADKDANGKSISGSRKEKVLQYINNLDADYETKILLYKSEYPSDDTYNAEIINYLNNRSDLTYDDRVAILTALGFRVVNGQIYAD